VVQSVAFARPSRPVTLRESRPPWQTTLRRIGELGRLALTALVLAVGLGGVAALTAAAPAHADSPGSAAFSAHADFPGSTAFPSPAGFTAFPAPAGSTAFPAPAGSVETGRPVVVAGRVGALRADSAGPRTEPAARRAPRSPDAAPRPAAVPPAGAPVDGVSLDHPAVDPTTGAVVRRGPPRH
jgi:hypothetical protein